MSNTFFQGASPPPSYGPAHSTGPSPVYYVQAGINDTCDGIKDALLSRNKRALETHRSSSCGKLALHQQGVGGNTCAAAWSKCKADESIQSVNSWRTKRYILYNVSGSNLTNSLQHQAQLGQVPSFKVKCIEPRLSMIHEAIGALDGCLIFLHGSRSRNLQQNHHHCCATEERRFGNKYFTAGLRTNIKSTQPPPAVMTYFIRKMIKTFLRPMLAMRYDITINLRRRGEVT